MTYGRVPWQRKAMNWSLSRSGEEANTDAERKRGRGWWTLTSPPERGDNTSAWRKTELKQEKVNLSLETFPEGEENIVKCKTLAEAIKSQTKKKQRNNGGHIPQHQVFECHHRLTTQYNSPGWWSNQDFHPFGAKVLHIQWTL